MNANLNRQPDRPIDYDAYKAIAMELRGQAFARAMDRLGHWIAGTLKSLIAALRLGVPRQGNVGRPLTQQ